jgi:hypothetical protein
MSREKKLHPSKYLTVFMGLSFRDHCQITNVCDQGFEILNEGVVWIFCREMPAHSHRTAKFEVQREKRFGTTTDFDFARPSCLSRSVSSNPTEEDDHRFKAASTMVSEIEHALAGSITPPIIFASTLMSGAQT